MKHKQQLPKNTEETKLIKNKKLRKVRSMMKFMKKRLVKIGKRALKRDPNLKRLEEAVQKLDKVSADVTTFLHLLDSAKKEQKEQEVDLYKARETGSLPATNDLIGRGEAKEFVTQWLKKLSNEHRDRNISLLSIVGHGGMGKTTLLQHVYEDEVTKEFDLKMWVCVSNNFDVKKVVADMLESLKKERPRLETLEALQDSLRTEIMSKKFLLVLDDVWEEEENRDISKWEKVLAPLAYGRIGSGILVTTRMDSVATMIAKVIKKEKETYKLQGLEEDQCLQLLNSHAFADVENPNDYKRLRSIAREIVKKLSGSPLAAKVIGGVLNSSLDERHWTKVLNSDFVSSKLGQDNIFPILRLSYMFLPKHLQNCFAFCSIFRQDYQFDKDDLVKMWIALGFIQQPHDQEWTMEDIGGSALTEIFKASRSLRLLYIRAPKDLEIILEEIRNLIHLRYLKIDSYNLTMLPRSVSNLYHLQYIIYDKLVRQGHDFLPSDINNLSNLRYVKLPKNCISSIYEIGKLNSLQELDMFDIRDVSGYRIGELKNMKDLCKLGINCLENVKDAEEARNAQLCEKRRLTDLTLCWSWGHTDSRSNIDLDENVLDNLQPPKCLRNLSIERYMGARSAIWMNNVYPISNLKRIDLLSCMEWETLPPFGQLPFLKTLTLCNMPKVKWFESKFNGNDKYPAFPLLEKLYIESLEALEDWFEAGAAAEDGCLFPSLIELELFDVPMLRELPNLPPSLKSLFIQICHPELIERYIEDGGSDRHKIAHIPHIYIGPFRLII